MMWRHAKRPNRAGILVASSGFDALPALVMRMAWALVAVLGLVGCTAGSVSRADSDESQESPTTGVGSEGAVDWLAPIDARFTSCTADAECVAVELGCCDSCNGGRVVAVASASADEVRRRYHETGCAEFACNLLACRPTVVSCQAGQCVVDEPAR